MTEFLVTLAIVALFIVTCGAIAGVDTLAAVQSMR